MVAQARPTHSHGSEHPLSIFSRPFVVGGVGLRILRKGYGFGSEFLPSGINNRLRNMGCFPVMDINELKSVIVSVYWLKSDMSETNQQ